MARIYLAGPWVHRDKMPEIADSINKAGHTITHPWWKYEGSSDPNKYGDNVTAFEDSLSEDFLRSCAELDVMGVKTADAVIVYNSAKSEGKATEQGIAIALGKPVIVVTPAEKPTSNVFHYLPNYTHVTTVEDAIAAI